MTTKEIIAVLEQAVRANREDRCREGNLIHLKGPGEVVMTGDLHGNERNFEKLVRFARLESNPSRHLILHELLHSANSDTPGQCHSYLLVARVAQLKARFPHQVHCLLGNHAMAQVTRDEVLKGGQAMVRALNAGLFAAFGSNSQMVAQAIDQFILSLPIAAKSDNRVWMSHSLPSSRHLDDFDNGIFEKELSLEDMLSDSSLHALIWDRVHNKKCLERLGRMWDVDMFIVGHQPQGQGYGRNHKQMIILACDHSHGCFLPFELCRTYEPDELFAQIKALAAIA